MSTKKHLEKLHAAAFLSPPATYPAAPATQNRHCAPQAPILLLDIAPNPIVNLGITRHNSGQISQKRR